MFEITEDHLKLLRKSYVRWDRCEYGAASIDPKRPYGNSYVEGNIVDILGWDLDEEGEVKEEDIDRCYEIHQETKTVLQICLVIGEFKTGYFRKTSEYDDRSWEEVNYIK